MSIFTIGKSALSRGFLVIFLRKCFTFLFISLVAIVIFSVLIILNLLISSFLLLFCSLLLGLGLKSISDSLELWKEVSEHVVSSSSQFNLVFFLGFTLASLASFSSDWSAFLLALKLVTIFFSSRFESHWSLLEVCVGRGDCFELALGTWLSLFSIDCFTRLDSLSIPLSISVIHAISCSPLFSSIILLIALGSIG